MEPSGQPELTPQEKLLSEVFGKGSVKAEDGPPLTEAEKADQQAALRLKIDQVLTSLTYRERELIKLRYGLVEGGQESTIEETGRIFKVTRDRVRQLEEKALRKLQGLVSTTEDTSKEK